MKFLLAAIMVALASPSRSQTCPTCIQNTAAPQNAQVNLGTVTVRGTLTSSTATVTYLNATNANIANLTGDGSAITSLNASQLLSGIVAAARVVGNYTGITGLGTVASGIWNGTPVGTQYGGTGQNFVTVSTGSLPYFNGVGAMAALPPSTAGRVLQTNGSAAPSWTPAPQILGTNVTAIPLANLSPGTLPTSIAVSSTSLPASIPAASVVGNIPGGASFLTVPLPIGNLAAGTLPTTNAASSITATGVSAGTYGGPLQMAQLQVRSDGRIQSATQFLLAVPTVNISTGMLPPGVQISANQISTGTLPNYVIASSVAATGVTPGTYGVANRTLTAAVQADGRISAISQPLIALPPSQVTTGALPAGVTIGASDIRSGSLPTTVIATSVTASGVAPGTYGGPTHLTQFTVGVDGRVQSASSILVPALSTTTVSPDVDNNWQHSQTFQSSVTVNSSLFANTIAGDGSLITGVMHPTGSTMTGVLQMNGSLAFINSGTSVTASGFFGNGSGLTGVFGTDTTKVAKTGDTMTGSLNMSNASIALTGPSGFINSAASVTASAFFGNGSGLNSVLDNTKVLKVGDTMTGRLLINNVGPNQGLVIKGLGNNNARIGLYDEPLLSVAPGIDFGYNTAGTTTTIAFISASQLEAGNPLRLQQTALGTEVLLFDTGEAVLGGGGDINNWITANISSGKQCIGCRTVTAGKKITIKGDTNVTASLDVGGNLLSSGTVTGISSITASAFFGNGSGLTNLPTAPNTFVSSVTFNDNVLAQASVTASGFFGNGSGLTGVTGTDSTKVAKTGDTMTGQLTLAGSSLTVNGRLLAYTNLGTPDMNAFVQISSGTKRAFVIYGSSMAMYGDGTSANIYQGRAFAAGTTLTAPGPVANGQNIVNFTGSGYDGSTWVAPSPAGFNINAASGPWNTNNHGANITVQTTGASSNTVHTMAIFASNSSFGVGTLSPCLGHVIDEGCRLEISGSSLFGVGNIGVSTITNSGSFVGGLGSSITLSGSTGWVTGQSSVTASAFFGNGAALTGVALSGPNADITSMSALNTISSALTFTSSTTNTSSAGSLVSSSVTASAFFGNGSGLTNVTGTDSTKVAKTGDTMTGTLTLTGATGSVVSAASVTASGFFGNGSGVTGVAKSGANSDITSMSALSTISSALTFTSSTTNTSSAGTLVNSSVTASGFFGTSLDVNGSTVRGQETVTSTITVKGNAFSVGTASFTVVGGSATVAYGITAGNFSATGPTGNFTTASSVTASGLFGNGSGITGVAKSGANSDITSLTGPLTINAGTTGTALAVSSGAFLFNVYGSSVVLYAPAGGTLPIFQTRVYSGTLAAPTAIGDAIDLGGISETAFDGTQYPSEGSSPGNLHYTSSGPWSSTSHGTTFSLFTTPINSTTRLQRVTVTDAGRVGINTTVPTSTFTVNGTANVTSSMTANAFFGDGSNLTGISVSSFTGISGSFSNTTYAVAMATVTMTTRGGPVQIMLNAMVENTNANKKHNAAFVVDGAYGTITSVTGCEPQNIATPMSCNATITVTNLSAGSHTFAVLFKTSANTGQVDNDTTNQSQFGAREVR